jgi:hypothetical protein
MSRISQDVAGQIATKITQKSRDVVSALRKEYESAVKEAYVSQIPDEVQDTFKRHSEWFSTNNQVKLHGHGFNWEWVSFEGAVICNHHRECLLKMDDKLGTALMKYKRAWEKAKADCEELRSEALQALLSLKTYKNIRENMPAAIPFLPPPITNALIVNVDTINKKLAHQPTIKKEEKVK